MNSCSIIPQVKDAEGNLADSRLFQDLLSAFDHDRAKTINAYTRLTNPSYKEALKANRFSFDSYNEPFFAQIYKHTDFKTVFNLPLGKIQDMLNRELGYFKRGENRPRLYPLKEDIYKKLVADVRKFNNTHRLRDLFVSRVSRVSDYEDPKREYYIKEIVPRNDMYSKEASNMEYNESLNEKLIGILSSHGVGIGALTELERRMKINGVTDFNVSELSANGLVELIRLAQGIKGKAALPEEFAHFVLRALGSNPLATRLINLIAENGLEEEIIGDSYQDYYNTYDGDTYKLAEEASGKLLARHLLDTEKVPPTKPYKNLLDRFISYIKEFFKKFSTEQIQRAMNEAHQDAGKLAKDILSGHLNNEISLKNITKKDIFYNTEEEVNKNKELLSKIIGNEKRRYAVYKSRGNRRFEERQQNLVVKLGNALMANQEKEGIFTFMQEVLEMLGKVGFRLNELKETPPESSNKAALVLRDVRNYLYSYSDIIREIKTVIKNSQEGEFSDEMISSLHKVSYILDELKIDYIALAKPLFINFLRTYYGDSKTIPFGKNVGETISVEDLADLNIKDISFFDRWLNSMASSSSYVANAMDAAVKEARNNVRLDTLDIQKKLQEAALRLEASGIKGFDWMFERADGKLTGKYIKDTKGLNTTQIEFYNTVMEIKKELDKFLPEGITETHNIIKIRKDLIERVKRSKGIKSGAKAIWDSIRDGWIQRSDDTDFGNEALTTDFEGNRIMKLPLFYLGLKDGESMNDMSTDIVSTMTAYAAMANDYKEMGKIVNVLELSRDMLRDAAGTGETRKGQNTIARINDFFEMQVYGRYMKDEGTIGNTKIAKAKVANQLNAFTAISKMAFSLLSGISNIATGSVQARIEAFAGQYFKQGNLFRADKNYNKSLPAFLGEIGKRVKISKLALWGELFDVQQDYDTKVKEMNFDRKSWFSRMFNSNTLFFLNNAGEHWMAYRTSLALADAYKMIAPDGKKVSLWDAMEVVYLDPNNKNRGARLQVKAGYKKEDGTEFTKEDILKFSKKTNALNQRMHGVYNKADIDAFQKISIGRMVEMFRKYLKENLDRRYKSVHYDERMEEWTEGYYRTVGRFLFQCVRDLREGQFALIANFKKLDDREKRNIYRAITEMGHVLALSMALLILDLGDDDDDDKPWLLSMMEYQARRLYTEIGSLTPGLQLPGEALKLIKQPAAAVSTMETMIDAIGILNPYNYEAIGGEDAVITRGKYKGHNKAYKLFFNTLPWQPVYKALHPEESIPFYKQ